MPESNTPINNLPDDDPEPDGLSVEVADKQSLTINRSQLVSAVQAVLQDHRIPAANISLAIVDDSTIHSLNRRFLQHDYPTDVLSFDLGCDTLRQWIEGEIVVSAQTAARVAQEIGSSLDAELTLYVIHGTLHLLGYDDKSVAEQEAMRRAEGRYLRQLGLVHIEPGTSDESGRQLNSPGLVCRESDSACSDSSSAYSDSSSACSDASSAREDGS